jgi:hypothetical protein
MIVNAAAKALKGMTGIERFKQWVLDVARRAAETSRGGFLSMTGSVPLDAQEIFAMTEIERIFA